MNEKFKKDLTHLLNIHGIDNILGVPDYLLSAHLNTHLRVLGVLHSKMKQHEATTDSKAEDPLYVLQEQVARLQLQVGALNREYK